METKDIIKDLRKKSGHSVKQVSAGTGISENVYPKYESGILNPGVPVLIKLADYYNVSVDYLLGREEPKNPLLEMAIKPINDEEMWQAYDKLPDIAKEIFVEVMEVLSKASRKKEEPKEIKQNVYPIPTLARGKKGVSVEYMTEEEINDILNAEDADEDL